MDTNTVRSPGGSGSRASHEAIASPSSPKASIPSAGIERIDIPEFHRRLKAQGVANQNHCALMCPICGTVQSMASLVAAGASPEQAERMIGFSCEGRLTGSGPWPNKPSQKRKAVRGCDWTLGGLFRIHKLEVITEDGTSCPRFELASPEEAQALASAMSARSAETAGLSPQDASAVPQADAQPLPSEPQP